MAYNNTEPTPVSLNHGGKRDHNGANKKGSLTSNTNDKRRKTKKLHFGSPRHKSPKVDTWCKHHIRGEFLVPQKVGICRVPDLFHMQSENAATEAGQSIMKDFIASGLKEIRISISYSFHMLYRKPLSFIIVVL
jgi:hypothetical protein